MFGFSPASPQQLDLLFQSLIISIFTFAIEIWGGASYNKYINKINKFINRVCRNDYITKRSDFRKIISERVMNYAVMDKNHMMIETASLHNLLPNKLNRNLRQGGHDYK